MTCPACGELAVTGAERCAACGRALPRDVTLVPEDRTQILDAGETQPQASGQTRLQPIGETQLQGSGETQLHGSGDAGDTRVLAPGEARFDELGDTQVQLTEQTPPGPGGTRKAPSLLWDSRYDVQELLGSGGMGSVYKAHDRVLDEAVALKLLKRELLSDAKLRERFKSEIRLARTVRHPNVCSIYEFGEVEQGPYISMELIAGSDLKRVLRDRGGLPGAQALELAIQVAEGLQAVHDAGIVHRDLKCANLMLDARGRVRLMDFGIAKKEGDRTLTTGQMVVGTPDYMSPEQAQGMKVGPRADIYALGVVIFELFTGRLPFSAPSPLGVALKHVHDEPPLEDPLIPPAVRGVLARALAKDPSARYATARAVAQALRAAQTEAAAPTAAALAGGAVPRQARRGLPTVLALVLLAAAAAALWIVNPGARPPTTTPAAGAVPAAPPPDAAAASKQQPASLLVVVRPWGELFVDGKHLGTTPLDWTPVPPGRHVVRVSHPSKGEWEQTVTLEPGEKRRLVVDLPSRVPRRE